MKRAIIANNIVEAGDDCIAHMSGDTESVLGEEGYPEEMLIVNNALRQWDVSGCCIRLSGSRHVLVEGNFLEGGPTTGAGAFQIRTRTGGSGTVYKPTHISFSSNRFHNTPGDVVHVTAFNTGIYPDRLIFVGNDLPGAQPGFTTWNIPASPNIASLKHTANIPEIPSGLNYPRD